MFRISDKGVRRINDGAITDTELSDFETTEGHARWLVLWVAFIHGGTFATLEDVVSYADIILTHERNYRTQTAAQYLKEKTREAIDSAEHAGYIVKTSVTP